MLTYYRVCCAFSSARALSLNVICIFKIASNGNAIGIHFYHLLRLKTLQQAAGNLTASHPPSTGACATPTSACSTTRQEQRSAESASSYSAPCNPPIPSCACAATTLIGERRTDLRLICADYFRIKIMPALR